MRDGVSPSCVVLPSQGSGLLLDFLCERLFRVRREDWLERMLHDEVVDEHGQAARPHTPFRPGLRYYYYRQLPHEAELPFKARVLWQDQHLLVADKPHFVPVVPAGEYLQGSALVQLKRALDLPELSPIHRIDRETAGLVVFSVQRATRGLYQGLFRDRAVHKVYEAVAGFRADLVLPCTHRSRLEESGQFFRMHEVPGEPNSCSHISLMQQHGEQALYRLEPVTGKRHQLRVHLASLGIPIQGDGFYPQARAHAPQDFSDPLQLLARRLRFVDPLTGQSREFCSQLQLNWPRRQAECA